MRHSLVDSTQRHFKLLYPCASVYGSYGIRRDELSAMSCVCVASQFSANEPFCGRMFFGELASGKAIA